MRALRQLKKLRGRSLDELRVRAAQMLHARAERAGWSEQAREPSDAMLARLLHVAPSGQAFSAAALLEHFRTRRAPHLSAAFDDSADAREPLKSETERRSVEAANRVLENRFDLLGLRDLDFGTPPDWHLESTSGRRTSLAHWSRIAYLDPGVAGDKKVTWELNRHQHFLTLGRAYRYTGDERYARQFVEHVASWMDANPPKRGINWASSLEVAFRAVAWLWALHFFRESPHLDAAILWRMYKFLYLHARHLETYLSTYFSPNTHLTGEALGLYYLGTLLPEFRAAERWRATGREVFLRTLARHIRADGVYFEHSTYYHRYTADFCLHYHILATTNGDALDEAFVERLTKLLDHLAYITKPDGTTPYFGDDDGGRFVPLTECAANDFRTTLATGAALLRRVDYKFVAELGAPHEGANTEEIYWMLGAEGVEAYERLEPAPPASASRSFPDGGYYCLRDAWTDRADYMMLDCGAHGSLNYGHAHADALSFELAARGRTLLVDPGTYTYTAAAAERDYFRSASAHNTLTIDNLSSSTPGTTAFTWRSTAACMAQQWLDSPRFDFFAGEHDGYTRLDALAPAVHRREVLFLKGDYWILRDTVAAAAPRQVGMSSGDHAARSHAYALHFHPAAGVVTHVPDANGMRALGEGTIGSVRLVCDGGQAIGGEAGGVELRIATVGSAGGAWRRSEGWVSEAYAARAHAPALSFEVNTAHTEAPIEFVTFLAPRASGEPETLIREIEAEGGRAFRVERERGEFDLLLIAEHEAAEMGVCENETPRVGCDGGWCWLRFDAGGRELRELIAIGARRVTLDGKEILCMTDATHVTARWGGRLLTVATDASGAWQIARSGCAEVVLNDGARVGAGDASVWAFEGREIADVVHTAEAKFEGEFEDAALTR